MTQTTERYQFNCRSCGERFTEEDSPPNSRIHIFAVALTLGLWLPIWAVWQWWWIYSLSRCPECDRRSRRLLITFLVLLLISGEVLWTYYYLMEIAPDQIAARTANPEPFSARENAIHYLGLAAGQYGLFVLVGWFLLFSVILLRSPDKFRVPER